MPALASKMSMKLSIEYRRRFDFVVMPIAPALSELELTRHMQRLAAKDRAADLLPCFLSGGCYDHFVPRSSTSFASRSSITPLALTPYQPEVSQGTLQVGFEFQTLMCQLTGLDVSNASLYEGATAVVEAAFMALGSSGRTGKVVISKTVNPEYRQTLATYLANLDTELVEVDHVDGVTDLAALAAATDAKTACVIVQSPNFFGRIEPVADYDCSRWPNAGEPCRSRRSIRSPSAFSNAPGNTAWTSRSPRDNLSASQ
ncbi:MAG: hypothetical protein U1D30_23860 [Planctomycetota bacterium]